MFFDHHLQGEENAPPKAPRPVRIYVMGTNEWRYEQKWPLARVQSKTLYLSSGGDAGGDMNDGRLDWTGLDWTGLHRP